MIFKGFFVFQITASPRPSTFGFQTGLVIFFKTDYFFHANLGVQYNHHPDCFPAGQAQSEIHEEADIMKDNLKKHVITALFAALTFAATMAIRIPTPGTSGYIHPGDALVILSGVILGPSYGFLAAGIGSALADLLGGYFIYVPITFVIKGLIALLSGLIYQKAGREAKFR